MASSIGAVEFGSFHMEALLLLQRGERSRLRRDVKPRYVSCGQLIQWGGPTCVRRIPRLLFTLETWQLIEAWKCNLPSIDLFAPED
jgi:hypothetical protein